MPEAGVGVVHLRITQIHGACSHADFDQSHERAVLLVPETPRKGGPLDPGALAAAQEFFRVVDTAMWRPGHVLGNGWITSVVVEHDLRVRNSGGLAKSREVSHVRSGVVIYEFKSG